MDSLILSPLLLSLLSFKFILRLLTFGRKNIRNISEIKILKKLLKQAE